jgi:hypothetical protein
MKQFSSTVRNGTGRMRVQALILCLAVLISIAVAFQPNFRSQRMAIGRTVLYASAEFSEAEAQEMEDLILSLSREPTDESRRARLGKVFAEALNRPNGGPKRFSDLFDKTIISVGDEVRSRAITKALAAQQAAVSEEGQTVDDETSSASPADDNMTGKSEDEQQVWALIDLLVQSKTIVKMASGELGNKGSFA